MRHWILVSMNNSLILIEGKKEIQISFMVQKKNTKRSPRFLFIYAD